MASYDREKWCHYWTEFFYCHSGTRVGYDYNGSVVYWFTDADNKEAVELMSTIWTLKEKGVRYTYQSKIRTFFWVDEKFAQTNRKKILDWADRHGCNVPSKKFMWIECPDDKTVTLFHLTWGG